MQRCTLQPGAHPLTHHCSDHRNPLTRPTRSAPRQCSAWGRMQTSEHLLRWPTLRCLHHNIAHEAAAAALRCCADEEHTHQQEQQCTGACRQHSTAEREREGGGGGRKRSPITSAPPPAKAYPQHVTRVPVAVLNKTGDPPAAGTSTGQAQLCPSRASPCRGLSATDAPPAAPQVTGLGDDAILLGIILMVWCVCWREGGGGGGRG